MSISVTQEEAKFRPVTIVIDDMRTANFLRVVLCEFFFINEDANLDGNVNSLNNYGDAKFAYDELKNSLTNSYQFVTRNIYALPS